jgi:hypothetical protein
VLASLPQISFERIRQHKSSQQRAWEELAYLLVPDIDGLPSATVLERRATPDGGVEFSCPAPSSRGTGTWAWQAKFLFKLDASAFGQMKRSFEDALDSTPDLSRYGFILPIDRTACTKLSKGTLASWDEHVVKWRATAAARGATVDFAYIGESQTLTALTLAHHVGAVRYFFDESLFTEEFFERQVHREVNNLGERYDPDVHVGLDIEQVIDGACRNARFATAVETAVKRVSRAGSDLREALADERLADNAALAAQLTAARDAAVGAEETLARVHRDLTMPAVSALRELRVALEGCSVAARTAADAAHEAARTAATAAPAGTAPPERGRGRRRPGGDPPEAQRSETQALYDAAARATTLRATVEAARRNLDAGAGRAAESGALLLQGPAGCGKSHLVAAAAAERVARGLPTLLVLGQHLRGGPLWPQIAAIIDRPGLSGEEILAALEVAARLRGGGRALLVVDAINEGDAAPAWRDRLAGWLDDIARYPWIAVALTIRDTYTAELLPRLPDDAIVRISHPGLAGHEEEGLARYAKRYGLRLPDVPPLLPELKNPLFLRSLCRAAAARGLDAIPREARSPSWVFAGLLDAVNDAVSDRRRLDIDAADRLVQRAADDLAIAMLDGQVEALSTANAKAVCEALLPGRSRSQSLFEALVVEGLLLRETARVPGSDDRIDRVRFTYQRLADHLRAHVLLRRHQSDDELKAAALTLAGRDRAWALTGMFEAMVLIVPEICGRELADILALRPSRRQPRRQAGRRTTTATRAREFLRDVLGRAFFDTLPWRTPESIGEPTLQLLDAYLQADTISGEEWLRLLLSLACIPNHPLNAERLDNALRRMTMSERDEQWSVPVLWAWSDDTDPVTRTIDWAWAPTTQTGEEVAKLTATLLAWLLTSSSRRLRDTATKALIRLLDQRTHLAAELVGAFAQVDDPYVVERVIAVACGHALRHRHDPAADSDALAALGETVYDTVFGRRPPPTHLLLRHYARTVVEAVDEALRRVGRVLDRDLARAAPPYESAWPLAAPRLRDLAHRYGRANAKYLSSATVIGYDFSHYILELGVSTDFTLPNQARRLAARRAAALRQLGHAVADGVAAIPSDAERAALEQELRMASAVRADADQARATTMLREALAKVPAPILDRIQTAALRATDRAPVRPDSDLLGRWIANRVLELGWTADRFEETDSMLGGFHSRESGTERIGKKYTWIAFYELLGHLADHCDLQESWGEAAPEPYDDPWQISRAPDLDPSIAIRGDEPPEGTAAARLRSADRSRERAWWLRAYDRTVSSDRPGAAWLDDTSDVPQIGPLLGLTDPSGGEWLVLESHVTWRPPDAGTARTGDDRHMWLRTQANIVRAGDMAKFRAWAKSRNWMGLWMPTPTQHPTGFVGGYPDMRPWPQRKAFVDAERRQFNETAQSDSPGWERTSSHGAPNAPFALATADYTAMADRDQSAVNLPSALLPAPELLDLLKAAWTGGRDATPELGLGEVERDYSWASNGRVVAFSSGGRGFGSTRLLCVRADALLPALSGAGLALWSWILGEKIYWSGGNPVAARAELYAAAEFATPPVVWGRTIDHRDWEDSHEVRRHLLIERP